MSEVFRCYTEKKTDFDIAAKKTENELREVLRLNNITVRLFNRYDIQNIPDDKWEEIKNIILSEPVSDICYDQLPPFPDGVKLLRMEPLPGQYDIRSDSCEQCIQMLLGNERPIVSTALIYALSGIDDNEYERVKKYLLNPLEYKEASAEKPDVICKTAHRNAEDIPVTEGFTEMDNNELEQLRIKLGLSVSFDDIKLTQTYFQGENRNPTLTELRVIDTYWSDHCRHSTFNTVIRKTEIKDQRVQKAHDLFLQVNKGKDITLMNIATGAMRELYRTGQLPMLYESEENNACTIHVKAEFEDKDSEDWLLLFKNETHNHPTEIEPFGGASTCIGGAIRDPLSGRAYVYHAMRISGAGDPRSPIEDTLPGKLPQRKLTVTAAEGFSSYGNQIGLATGIVKEFYHNGYIAKRLETGAVVGAAPVKAVCCIPPAPGDAVILLGGRTGRDGIGGATGSSKIHGSDTVSECACEVQKGNAPEERKLQRLFRNPDVTKLIKRCNDFGAGGAAVAIGELSGGVEINLDAMPVKYEGLDGTELAISESQERMAVVTEKENIPLLMQYAKAENAEATIIADITDNNRLVMKWRGKEIVSLKRDFLDSNGARRYADVCVPAAPVNNNRQNHIDIKDHLIKSASDINFCSSKGLTERFDSSIGASAVFMPFGGKYALTETQVMASLLPVEDTHTASVMAYGFDPYYTQSDPFGGSVYAVVTSVAKLIAAGTDLNTIHLTLQEYFPRLYDDPIRWSLPYRAMLGAFSAQMGLSIAAIGGKDSMSGSFGDYDVPPTLISFAVGTADARVLISPEFKEAGHPVYILETPVDSDGLPDYPALKNSWKKYSTLFHNRKVLSSWVCENGNVYGGIFQMAMGNKLGFTAKTDMLLYDYPRGSIIFESNGELDSYRLIGYTQPEPVLKFDNVEVSLHELINIRESVLENVFPVKTGQQGDAPLISDDRNPVIKCNQSYAKPKAVIPVFPGTNCEYDTANALERAGAATEIILVRNLTSGMLHESVEQLDKAINNAQMLIFPGGFSGGDEPDGSGKFIVSLFRNERLKDAVHNLLYNNDGLILGICNGFQALVKLGLLPWGNIGPVTAGKNATLTFNRIGRHQARYVNTRVASCLSPWLSKCSTGQIYSQSISHGEGRFTATQKILGSLKENGQIAFQYTDIDGVPSMDTAHNPNGSLWAIEGICSPDGRVLGKMAHTERYGKFVAKNIPGNKFMPLFEGGVHYFR